MTVPSNKELDGKVAIVTGAGRNIGRAIALSLAAAGAAVLVNARENRDGVDSVAGEVQDMIGAVLERFGRIDILVNNAALRRESPLETMAVAEWREVMATILDGAFHCAQACVPHLRQSGAGAIVNIGGMTGHTGAKNRAHVVAAKAGLAGLTRALAQELAGDNITVNCVSPGLIDTVRGGTSTENPDHHRISRNVVGRRGTPQEVATAVRYLCGPGARYVTGQVLHVNGGAWMG